MELSDLQKKILRVFANQQSREDEGTLYLNDEASVVVYRTLENDTQTPRKDLKEDVLILRNLRLIELVTAFDADYIFRAGSGYFLTNEGVKICTEYKLSDELEHT